MATASHLVWKHPGIPLPNGRPMCLKGYVESVCGHNSFHIHPTISQTLFVPCSYHVRTMFVPFSYHFRTMFIPRCKRTFCLVLIGCSIRTILVPLIFVLYSYHHNRTSRGSPTGPISFVPY